MAETKFAMGAFAICVKNKFSLNKVLCIEADRELAEGMDIFQSLNDKTNEALCLEHLGKFYVTEKRPDLALHYYCKAQDIFANLSDRTAEKRLRLEIKNQGQSIIIFRYIMLHFMILCIFFN